MASGPEKSETVNLAQTCSRVAAAAEQRKRADPAKNRRTGFWHWGDVVQGVAIEINFFTGSFHHHICGGITCCPASGKE